MHAAIAKTYMRLTDLLDPVFQGCLIAPLGLAGVKRPVDPQSAARLAD